jgi:hypothetical protein
MPAGPSVRAKRNNLTTIIHWYSIQKLAYITPILSAFLAMSFVGDASTIVSCFAIITNPIKSHIPKPFFQQNEAIVGLRVPQFLGPFSTKDHKSHFDESQ